MGDERPAGPSRGRAGGAPGGVSERRQGGSSPNRVCFSPALVAPRGYTARLGNLEPGRPGTTLAQTFCPGGPWEAVALVPSGGLSPSAAARARHEARGHILP